MFINSAVTFSKRLGLIIVFLFLILAGVSCHGKNQVKNERIKAFSIDFNWVKDRFAPPGTFSGADPATHVKWYKELGVNTIQTFCVNCCGYAWFRSDVVPVQPGMKGDFLKEITELAHKDNMKVMGYFCVGANTYWGQTHPDMSYGTPGWIHIPFTTEYNDYLCASIKDALVKTDIDGFMLDWFFNIIQPDTIRWLDCEKKMYTELFNEPFPAVAVIDSVKDLEFRVRAADRCWDRIKETVKSTKPDCIIWLSNHALISPQVYRMKAVKEVDWLMNENPDTSYLDSIRTVVGPKTKLIQCICGWGDKHDAGKIMSDPKYRDVGFYGFARPDELTTIPPENSTDPALAGNAKNIAVMRKAFNMPN